jgi:hypothetical protein
LSFGLVKQEENFNKQKPADCEVVDKEEKLNEEETEINHFEGRWYGCKKRLGEKSTGANGHSHTINVIFLSKKKNEENTRE